MRNYEPVIVPQDGSDVDAATRSGDDDDDEGGDASEAMVLADDDDGAEEAANAAMEDEGDGAESDMIMLSDEEVLGDEKHPFQVLLDEEAAEVVEPKGAVPANELSLDPSEDSQLETKIGSEGQQPYCIPDETPPRERKAKKPRFSEDAVSSPRRKFKDLSEKLRLLKLKQSQRKLWLN